MTRDSIRRDMTALPPRKDMKDKYYIGFFMTDVSIQHKGIGTQIITELCTYLQKLQYEEIRLGWVKGNTQSESFWHKNAFIETGDSYDTDDYTVVVARRKL